MMESITSAFAITTCLTIYFIRTKFQKVALNKHPVHFHLDNKCDKVNKTMKWYNLTFLRTSPNSACFECSSNAFNSSSGGRLLRLLRIFACCPFDNYIRRYKLTFPICFISFRQIDEKVEKSCTEFLSFRKQEWMGKSFLNFLSISQFLYHYNILCNIVYIFCFSLICFCHINVHYHIVN